MNTPSANPYPRIHSLGTVNIIHHQEFFYRFHPFRTDFIGDSGVGKSIITDLLQLILIGSSEYSSATHSKDDRPFNTLTLKTTDDTDFGYAFINVETDVGQYLVLGTYIARNQNQSQAFVIQHSLDFDAEKLVPLEHPIGIDLLERDGNWLPIDELDRHLNEVKDLGFKKFRQFSKYHQLLHVNELLPLDITADHALKDYAKILQTFARKNINIKDGVDLQDFLFGRQWRTHFKKEFDQVVSSMKDNISTFRTNREYLDKIERKQEKLKALYDLKNELDTTKTTWQQLQHYHLSQQKQTVETAIKTLLKQYFESRAMLEVLKKTRTDKIKELDTAIPFLKERKATHSKEADSLKKPVDLIKQVEDLMVNQRLTDTDALREFHRKFNANRVLYDVLQHGEKLLAMSGLTQAFGVLDHVQGLGSITQQLHKDITAHEQELSTKKALLACNDIDNPHSLVYWALENKPRLSVEQESMVLYFQQQSVETQEPDEANKGHRFIPDPKVVMEAKTHKSDSGFWADFGGVYSFFDYPEKGERLFDGKDEATINAKFRENRQALQKRISELNKSIAEKGKLQTFLTEVNEPQKFLEAWPQRENFDYWEADLNNEVLNWSNTQLNIALKAYPGREKARLEFAKAEKERDDLIAQLSESEKLKRELDELAVLQLGTVDDWMETLRSVYKPVLQQEQQPKLNESTYYSDFKSAHDKAAAGLMVQTQISQFEKELEKVTGELTGLELESTLDFQKEPPSEFSEEKLADAKKSMDALQGKYTRAFGEVVASDDMVQNDRSRLEQTEDFTVLVRHVLPAIFQQIDFNETEVWDKITDYMDEILHKNAELNKNKLVKVRDLLQDLKQEIATQTNNIREVGNMLNKREAEISGGLKASLKSELNDRIGVGWITQFLEDMPDMNEGLWNNAIEGYLNDRQQISIDDLIKDEYRRYTDHPWPQITIEELLSPFSYYSLNYKIRTGSGITNSGSTGQTYTAMALLCIAKLSMMKKEHGHQSDGLRFMSIDEAAGIGSNMDMLETIARKYGYQILSLSIPLHRVREGAQHIYRLYKASGEEFINKHPVANFSQQL
jgi:hypothetical protein